MARVSFLCVCSVIDHEFRHNIVKVAADYSNFSAFAHVSVRLLTIKLFVKNFFFYNRN